MAIARSLGARVRTVNAKDEWESQGSWASASCGVTAGMGERSKSLRFRVTMCSAPHARAAATCMASSKSGIGRDAAYRTASVLVGATDR